MKLFNRFKQTPQEPEMRKEIMILQPSEKYSIIRMDGKSVEIPSDVIGERKFLWTRDSYYMLIPGIMEWVARYRQATDFMAMATVPEFDWLSWHRDGLLYAKEIYKNLPRNIPFRYEIPATDTSGLVESFDVTEETIDSLLENFKILDDDREPVICEKVVTLAKDDDGALAIKLKINEKNREYVFHIEYPSMTFLKVFLEKIAMSKGEPVGWDSKYSRSGIYFYPQTIGNIKHMGQFQMQLDGKSEPVIAAYVNSREFVRSIYRNIMSVLTSLADKTPSQDLRSNIVEWYIDDERYPNTPMPSRNPINIRWLADKVSKLPNAKDMINKAFEDIMNDEV